MSFSSERASIESRFQTLWASATDLVFENVAYTPAQGTPYTRLSIKNGDTQRITIGTRQHRAAGLIVAQIFVPFGGGSDAARTLADTAAAIFRDQTFDGILCRSSSIQIVGQSGDWFQVNVSTAFQRDEIFA
jgi:hypothetical protein